MTELEKLAEESAERWLEQGRAPILHRGWCSADRDELASVMAELARRAHDLGARGEREACATAAAIHSQYPIKVDFDLGYDKGRRDAAAAIRERGGKG